MGPLIPQDIISGEWNNVFALLIGVVFGFFLEATGFSSSRKLAGVFYGYDFIVLKFFFTAAITAAVGMIYFEYVGWIDLDMIFVNQSYVTSLIIGGVIMGVGFIMGGYCPGTSLCGAAIGKIDAWVFTGGMFLGVFIFSEAFPLFEGLYNSENLGPIKIYESLGISRAFFVFALIVVALGMFYLTGIIQKKVKKVEY